MSNTRYIEISSEYRNRNDWPLSSEFEVPLSVSGITDKTTARDPISDCAPITSWISNNVDKNTSGGITSELTILDTTAGPAMGDAGNYQTVFVTSAASGDLQNINNYYVGLMGKDTSSTTLPTTDDYHRVVSYEYLGIYDSKDYAKFVFDGAFSIGTTSIYIVDPTDTTPTVVSSTVSLIQVFVPNGRIGENAYPNYLLYNETRGQSAPIVGYDSTTHLLQANVSSVSPYAWADTDAFSIRKCVPMLTQSLAAPASLSTSSFSLSVSESNQDGTYTGDFIRIIDSTPTRPVAAPTYEIRRIQKYLALDTTIVNATPEAVSNAFTLASGSTTNNYYLGAQILIGGVYYTITSYTYNSITGTYTGTVSTAIGSNSAGVAATIRSAIVHPAFSTTPTSTNSFEILSYSRDNFNPLMYSGSMVSQNQPVCYEIELLNVVLPNRVLTVGQGSRIAFYPYVYVELTNVSSPGSGTRNVIYSNNPNSTRMLFRAPIDDIPNPLVSSFIKIDSDGAVQSVKFKPNDTLHFSVRLPNGELYQTVLEEYTSPLPPNAENQISAIFSIKNI